MFKMSFFFYHHIATVLNFWHAAFRLNIGCVVFDRLCSVSGRLETACPLQGLLFRFFTGDATTGSWCYGKEVAPPPPPTLSAWIWKGSWEGGCNELLDHHRYPQPSPPRLLLLRPPTRTLFSQSAIRSVFTKMFDLSQMQRHGAFCTCESFCWQPLFSHSDI